MQQTKVRTTREGFSLSLNYVKIHQQLVIMVSIQKINK